MSQSCEQGCPAAEEQDNQSLIGEAFIKWRESLNYMDKEVIDEAYGELTQKVEEAKPCVVIDSTVMANVDSINLIYSIAIPESHLILKAEKLTRHIEGDLTFQ